MKRGNLSKQELAALKQIKGRAKLLAPKAVVDAARNKKHPLHERFEWDDRKLADCARLDQARDLIQAAVEVDASIGEPMRVYVSLSTCRANGGGYHETSDVLSNAELRQIMLMDALREIEFMRTRFSCLTELAPIFAHAESVKSTIIKAANNRRKKAA